MDEDTLAQFDEIDRKMRKRIYSICRPEHMLFDLDSTLLNTYGTQEGEAFNYHYQAHGYHPLLCFDGLLKLLKIAAKAVHTARYVIFKLCISCPYKKEFYDTPANIRLLRPQRE